LSIPLPIAVDTSATPPAVLELLPNFVNRHGCITGATGTGKTVTLQAIAQALSGIGVPVFMADIKGDLSGIARPGAPSDKLRERLQTLGVQEPAWQACPVTFWDVFGEQGHPVRATVSDLGPLLLGRMLALNDTQAGVLQLVFKVADDQGLLLLDLKDLRAMIQHVGDNAATYRTGYGNISPASIGAIQRALLAIEEQGGERFFGEPMLDINDLLQTDAGGKGVVNILAADKLMNSPQLYSVFLLWMLAELYENLPEVGDQPKPKLVFFFDEAHLLFDDAPKALLDKIEQVVRLVRSKGVGVFFVTQNPLDIPDAILGQLGNRVQHALRAYTPRDQKAVRAAAETFRPNSALDTAQAITELAVGEALVSFLDEQGRPNVVRRAFVLPPASQIGAIDMVERGAIMGHSLVAGVYDTAVDRDSAYEKLAGRVSVAPASTQQEQQEQPAADASGTGLGDMLGGLFGKGGRGDSPMQAMIKTAARSIGSQVGRQIVRGVLGSIFKGR
jgi:DNA helicase HerA-like ATPase